MGGGLASVPFARRTEAYVGGVSPRVPFCWLHVQPQSMVEDENSQGGRVEHRSGGAVACYADRVTSEGVGVAVAVESGANCHVDRQADEAGGLSGPGGVDVAVWEDFNYLPEAVRVAYAKISAALAAFDVSAENEGYFFDFRDGSQVHGREYLKYSEEERGDMQIAEEEQAHHMSSCDYNERRDRGDRSCVGGGCVVKREEM